MLNIDKPKKKEQLLLDAFQDENFKKQILVARFEIEQEIEKFIDYLKKNLKPEQRIFDSIETRVKGYDSFKEKIRRKDYVGVWKTDGNIEKTQKVIAASLPDLIGCRITCFFGKTKTLFIDIFKTIITETISQILNWISLKIERKKTGTQSIRFPEYT